MSSRIRRGIPLGFLPIGSAFELGLLPFICEPNVAPQEPMLQLAKLTVARYARWGALWQSQREPPRSRGRTPNRKEASHDVDHGENAGSRSHREGRNGDVTGYESLYHLHRHR